MTVLTQAYPLWLAEIRNGQVWAGRVVGWLLDGTGEQAAAVPLVAFTLADGTLLETGRQRGAGAVLGDSRAEVLAVVGPPVAPADPAAAFPPVPDDEPGADPHPGRRPLTQLHRTTLADVTPPPEPDPLGPRFHRLGNT